MKEVFIPEYLAKSKEALKKVLTDVQYHAQIALIFSPVSHCRPL